MEEQAFKSACRGSGMEEEQIDAMWSYHGAFEQISIALRAMTIVSVLLVVGKCVGLLDIPGWVCPLPFAFSVLASVPAAFIITCLAARKAMRDAARDE